MNIASSINSTVSAVSTLRERLQLSFGTPQERTNLISAAFIHRLKQRVQQRREENALIGLRMIGDMSDSSEEEEYEDYDRRVNSRRVRGSVSFIMFCLFLVTISPWFVIYI